ncbi:MAG: GNAT family N-acetyltransferase [Thermomicrobiales bacterium]|nr:GNAT family N-acetyltransferase [Thermomicrobiales bacterium]
MALHDLTLETFHAAIRLKVAPDQERFVADNLYSIAESAVRPNTWPYVAFRDEEIVGFVLLSLEPERGRYWILRFMIDAAFQGQRLGTAMLQETIALLVARHHVSEIYLSFEPGNEVAEYLYERAGFRRTGEIEDDEIVMRLAIPQSIEERQI